MVRGSTTASPPTAITRRPTTPSRSSAGRTDRRDRSMNRAIDRSIRERALRWRAWEVLDDRSGGLALFAEAAGARARIRLRELPASEQDLPDELRVLAHQPLLLLEVGAHARDPMVRGDPAGQHRALLERAHRGPERPLQLL